MNYKLQNHILYKISLPTNEALISQTLKKSSAKKSPKSLEASKSL
jgi:hypothetical protein